MVPTGRHIGRVNPMVHTGRHIGRFTPGYTTQGGIYGRFTPWVYHTLRYTPPYTPWVYPHPEVHASPTTPWVYHPVYMPPLPHPGYTSLYMPPSLP